MTTNIEISKPILPINIQHTDAAPGQYKCRQNFYNIARFGGEFNNSCHLIHKFAAKYRFKGSWDAVGKVVKERIRNNELSGKRCATAWDVYITLRDDLVDKEKRKKLFEKLDSYELNGDERVLQNTTYTTRHTHIGYATEDKSECDSLIAAGFDNIIFTNRETLNPDIVPLKDTLKTSQFQGEPSPNAETGQWTITTSILPCSCIKCRVNPLAYNDCYYKDVRGIKKEDIKLVDLDSTTQYDEYGIHELTVKELRKELNERGIKNPKSLIKEQLRELLRDSIDEQILFGCEGFDNVNDE